uniref:Endo/exonuclease/phosphatase domain-containing protein n=1 Tax=Haemonchus contortus TaxID=6289 RepID=A0A7I4Z0J3_HAECO
MRFTTNLRKSSTTKSPFYKFVVGDFNARLGEAREEFRIGKFGMGDRNENGYRLAGLLSAARLFHGNSFFQKEEHRRWTWESPNGTTHAELDHVLTNRKWCLLDVGVVPSFCSGSDHRLLRAKIRFSHKLEKISQHRAKSSKHAVYDGDVLNDVLSRYDWQVLDDPTEDYDALVRGLLSCAEQAKLPRVDTATSLRSRSCLETEI